MMISFTRAIFVFLIVGLGCDRPAPAPSSPPPVVERQPAAPAPAIAPTLDDVERDAYAYAAIGKRDPFKSIFGERPEPEYVSELQSWNLDQLKLIAVVTGKGAPYAMVEDPDGKGLTVRRGDYIGKDNGRVIAIREREVVIREKYLDYTGRRVVHDATMVIPEPALALTDHHHRARR